jgi:hypothetical protein
MRVLLLVNAFVRCADAYFSYSRMRYEDPMYTNEIIVPDIMPVWVKNCFNESLYKGRLCTPQQPISRGIMYVDCPSGMCTNDVIDAYHAYGEYNNMGGIVFNGHFPNKGTCKIPSTFILSDIGRDANSDYPSYIGLQEPKMDLQKIIVIYRIGMTVVVFIFSFIIFCSYIQARKYNIRMIIVPDIEQQVPETQQQVRVITDTQFDKNTDEATCPICIESFEEDETVSKLSCGHTYKPQCIRDWLKKESRCPLCNAEN